MESEKIVVSPYTDADLILIRAVTNLHPGVGRGGEIVDLPVQKDNMGFAMIYSSSLKGALKSSLWDFNPEVTRALLGPEVEEDERFNSAVAVLDAFTVAFPARSLEGVYAYVTSPLQLKRLCEYLKLIGKSSEFQVVENLSKLEIGDDICYMSNDKLLVISELKNRIIINEEITVEYLEKNEEGKDLSEEIGELEKILDIEKGRLTLLSNNNALRAMEKSFVRVTRTALERETKKVKTGALWIEEYIPWDTRFATTFLYSKPRISLKNIKTGDISKENLEKNPKKVLHKLLNKIDWYLIIGGDETVGKGIVRLKVLSQVRGQK